jgi:hypothetical protein
LITVNARRAARQAFCAIRAGSSERILGLPAVILARAQGVFPGLVADLMSVANRLLPQAKSDSEMIIDGIELEKNHGGFYRALTLPGRYAGEELNQRFI